MNVRYLNKNEECYKAVWINLNNMLNKAFKNNYIDKNSIKDSADLSIINKSDISFTEFEHIVKTYSNHTLEQIFSTSYGLYKIPDYETEDASLTLDIDG